MAQCLFNFFMNGHFLENRVVFLEFETPRSVFAVFGSDVSAHTGHSAGLMLGAFKDHLHTIAFCFLCHNYIALLQRKDLNVFEIKVAFSLSSLKSGVETDFVDSAESTGADAKLNPHVLFYPVELLGVQVHIESAFGAAL